MCQTLKTKLWSMSTNSVADTVQYDSVHCSLREIIGLEIKVKGKVWHIILVLVTYLHLIVKVAVITQLWSDSCSLSRLILHEIDYKSLIFTCQNLKMIYWMIEQNSKHFCFKFKLVTKESMIATNLFQK